MKKKSVILRRELVYKIYFYIGKNVFIVRGRKKCKKFLKHKRFFKCPYHTETLDKEHYWFNQNSERHRDGDKPAIEHVNGDKIWYKDGKFHRDGDKPAIEHVNGDKFWYQNGKRHRDGDKPAVIYGNGEQIWYCNGAIHRDGDKPAVVYASGEREYYKHGTQYSPQIV